MGDPTDLVLEAEHRGYDSVWTAEAYGSDLGKPLKLIAHPWRSHVPVYIGAEGPKNVRMATEIADGWLPLFFSPYRFDAYAESLRGRRAEFEIAATVTVVINNDVQEGLLPVKMALALYLGGMGAREKNFHLDLTRRMGFGGQATRVQELFLTGKRDEAIAAVPDQLADEIALVGPPERIRDRLQAWIASPVTTIIAGTREPNVLRLLAAALR